MAWQLGMHHRYVEEKETKLQLHLLFTQNDKRTREATDILDKFNCYFTDIGPKTASDTSGEPPFRLLLHEAMFVVIWVLNILAPTGLRR